MGTTVARHNPNIISVTVVRQPSIPPRLPSPGTLVAAFIGLLRVADTEGIRMTKAVLMALAALTLCASGAMAQERATDAALGAVSGAVVLGPVGAVAGALIGYTAGPAISRSWGVRGRNSSARQSRRVATRETPTTVSANDARSQANAQMVAPARPPAPKAGPAAPPVQALE
jgi:hypothetical protein